MPPAAFSAPRTADGIAHPPAALAPPHREWLDRLELTLERPLSDDGDSFVTLLCRDRSGAQVVLKYVSTAAPDAFRRLGNEARLLAALPTAAPLRLPTVRASARSYLLTTFDPGVLLRPATIGDARVVELTVKALLAFQRATVDCRALGVVDREPTSRYYLKVLTKHLAHLWPAYLSAREAAQCIRIVRAARRAIGSISVPCHGDFMPTNLLYDATTGAITFTDLEGFMTANHPLFDVLALLSVTDRPLADWDWQRQFLREYVTGAEALGVRPRSQAFRDAYRGILTFFLVYRFNEARLLAGGHAYFDGVSKSAYLRRKARDLVLKPASWRLDGRRPDLTVHAANLRGVLSRAGFDRHLDAMLGEARE